MIQRTRLPITNEEVEAFCRRWKIARFSLFGSVLRNDFGPDSDVDVLISFAPAAEWSLWDWSAMVEELRELFGREVDVIEESGLRNPFRRHEILRTRDVIYEE